MIKPVHHLPNIIVVIAFAFVALAHGQNSAVEKTTATVEEKINAYIDYGREMQEQGQWHRGIIYLKISLSLLENNLDRIQDSNAAIATKLSILSGLVYLYDHAGNTADKVQALDESNRILDGMLATHADVSKLDAPGIIRQSLDYAGISGEGNDLLLACLFRAGQLKESDQVHLLKSEIFLTLGMNDYNLHPPDLAFENYIDQSVSEFEKLKLPLDDIPTETMARYAELSASASGYIYDSGKTLHLLRKQIDLLNNGSERFSDAKMILVNAIAEQQELSGLLHGAISGYATVVELARNSDSITAKIEECRARIGQAYINSLLMENYGKMTESIDRATSLLKDLSNASMQPEQYALLNLALLNCKVQMAKNSGDPAALRKEISNLLSEIEVHSVLGLDLDSMVVDANLELLSVTTSPMEMFSLLRKTGKQITQLTGVGSGSLYRELQQRRLDVYWAKFLRTKNPEIANGLAGPILQQPIRDNDSYKLDRLINRFVAAHVLKDSKAVASTKNELMECGVSEQVLNSLLR